MKNKELVKAFKAAKPYLKNDLEEFICYSLYQAFSDKKITYQQRDKAIEIIHDRLGNVSNCVSWLRWNIEDFDHRWAEDTFEGCEEMRAYRLRWLDSLIEEFS